MKLIRTIKKPVSKKTFSKNPYQNPYPNPYQQHKPIDWPPHNSLHRKAFQNRHYNPFENSSQQKIASQEARQLGRNSNQSTDLHTTLASTKRHFRTDLSNNRIQIFKS